MTVETTNSTISYTGNNSVTTFTYNFLTYSEDHLFIYLDDVEQTSGFSVTGIGDEDGGDIIFNIAPSGGVEIRIDRTVPETQLIEYQEYGPFKAKTNERGLDLGVMIGQQSARDTERNSSKKMDKRPTAPKDNIVVFDDTGNSLDSGVNVASLKGDKPDYLKETKTLSDGQLVVTFINAKVTGSTISIGKRSGDGRVLEVVDDYNITGDYEITLTESYDAGTICFAVTSEAVNSPGDFVKKYLTIDGPINDIGLNLNDVVSLKERTTGNGGGAIWNVVDITTVTPNTFDIVTCTGNVGLALVIDATNSISLESLIDDPLIENDAAYTAWIQHPQKNKTISSQFWISNIEEIVDGISVTGGGTIRSTSGAGVILRIIGDNNHINGITINSSLSNELQDGVLSFIGDGNIIENCILGWDTFFNPTLDGDQYGANAIFFSGDNNTAHNNKISNVTTGIFDNGRYNKITNNNVFTACRGVILNNKSRYAIVENNYFDMQYGGQGLGSCDGIWGNRNHRFSTITGNTILRAGEHATYLQGDSFTVTNNIIGESHSSGIKCGGKVSGLFWYGDETPVLLAPNGDYTGFNFVISNNVCYGGQTSGGNTGEIYIQPNCMDFVIDSNMVSDTTGYGIRTVFFSGGTSDEVMKGITVSNNKVRRTGEASISCSCSDSLLITNNDCDNQIRTYSRDAAELMVDGKVLGNICSSVFLQRMIGGVIESNTANFMSVTSGSVVLYNNEFTNQELGGWNGLVTEAKNNRFTYAGDVREDIDGCDKIEGNTFTFPDAVTSYPLNVVFDGDTPNQGLFNDNIIICVSVSRPLRIGGEGSSISGNTLVNDGTADRQMSCYSKNCVISGNALNPGSIRMELESLDNVISANAATISDAGTGNILGTNRI